MLKGILRIFASITKRGNAVPKAKPDGTFDASWGFVFTDSLEKEDFTLDAGDITNKYITLADTPVNNASIELKVNNAGSQIYGIAYQLIGDTINWTALDLDTVLAVGDIISVRYII